MSIVKHPSQLLSNLEIGRLSEDDLTDETIKLTGSIALTGVGVDSLAEGRYGQGVALTTLGIIWTAAHGLGVYNERKKRRQNIVRERE